MLGFPKPRGFWDYAFFALIMAICLSGLFWLEANRNFGWADVLVASVSALIFVSIIILFRRKEKAVSIKNPTRGLYRVAIASSLILLLVAVYVDAYLLHRSDLTSARIWHDLILCGIFAVSLPWILRR